MFGIGFPTDQSPPSIVPVLMFGCTSFLARRLVRRRLARHAGAGASIADSRADTHEDAADSSSSVGAPSREKTGRPAASLSEARSLTSREVSSLRSRHMSSSNSVSYSNTGALHLVSGRGCYLTDAAGRSYLDTRNNVAHVGHTHPEVVAAVSSQLAAINSNTRYLHGNASLLAAKLASLLPDPLEKVFFVNSGSEANDLALRLARAHSMARHGGGTRDDRRHVIAIDHGYHGHTLACLDVSPYKYRQGSELTSYPGAVRKVPCPDTYRGVHRVEEGLTEGGKLEQEAEAGKLYSLYVEKECESITSSGGTVSAFIVEGGMSVAGVVLPPTSYLRRCADAIRRAGGLYIADEVQTGFGRLGRCEWAFQYTGREQREEEAVVPDIVTVGKPFGNGLPLAAVVTSRDVAESFESTGVEYFNTFAGSPACCAAGLAVLHILEQEELRENAAKVGDYLLSLLADLKSRTPWLGDVRGSGLFVGVELVRNKTTREPATAEASFVCSALKERHGILTSVDGPDDSVIVVKPPLVFGQEEAKRFVSCLERVLVEELPAASMEQVGRTPT